MADQSILIPAVLPASPMPLISLLVANLDKSNLKEFPRVAFPQYLLTTTYDPITWSNF